MLPRGTDKDPFNEVPIAVYFAGLRILELILNGRFVVAGNHPEIPVVILTGIVPSLVPGLKNWLDNITAKHNNITFLLKPQRMQNIIGALFQS
ncbi:MAG: hypothetical protein UX02_C0004G0006 [Candidatus Moranbacteria bacterium GW2011_GWC1_45_18]|nr:MAG: hypothetical protein UT79_C0003G0083 [Candidatus Moranbacteria bacterium GW2011_GWC2_40_12]KKT33304.1 MAG: hypothetical protein UW19_C0010G0045 [Candidatus Moranbacteria bacterium GW2011_GWF2_44_10]KKT99286.1 MAG: hypothetical protein UX02_C0004G0006 [Candidatus Moranbacteria bacterium GW2011_GWC1_45_18]OGI40645.1 MAG: hypothetical protein A2374_00160 [Candidatus Moranbacteria bacterium RIFOXYB1_FULL_44_23]